MIVIAIFGALLCVAPTSARAQFFGAPSQNSRHYATQQPQGRAATNAGQSQALAQQAGTGFYRGVAQMLVAFLAAEHAYVDELTSCV